MANHNDLIVWVDCEMTGLSLTKDALIEIAVVVTDSHLNEMDPGIDIVIKCEDEKLDSMIDVVKEMHTASGFQLIAMPQSISIESTEQQIIPNTHLAEQFALLGNQRHSMTHQLFDLALGALPLTEIENLAAHR